MDKQEYVVAVICGGCGAVDGRDQHAINCPKVPTKQTITTGIETVSVTNRREHWGARSKRSSKQRASIMRHMLKAKPYLLPAIKITMTRIGRELDDDNLRSALKSVRDGIAAHFKVDDRTHFIQWEYKQRQGEPGVEVMVEEID